MSFDYKKYITYLNCGFKTFVLGKNCLTSSSLSSTIPATLTVFAAKARTAGYLPAVATSCILVFEQPAAIPVVPKFSSCLPDNHR